MRIFWCMLAVAVLGASGAKAAEEQKCSEQFSLEEHQYLEWAALGGDPHAQFALAKCAAPRTKASLSSEEKVYALKWLTLAACESDGLPNIDERDRMTRRMKFEGDISFRRFGGITEKEVWTAREKKFIEYREAEIDDLKDRYKDFVKDTTPAQQAAARGEISDELARLGPLGLVRLTSIAECKYFGGDDVFAAAAYSAANQAWQSSGASKIYGKSSDKDWGLDKQSAARMSALAPIERRAAEAEKARLLRTDPYVLAELEDQAALSRLNELSFMHEESGRVSFAGRAVTLAVQYALESLGWMEFVNGPDNDYGPSTIEAVRKMQASEGLDETRWLSPDEIRSAVCKAATKEHDPISYYHLAVMFSEGWGYSKDLERAAFAASRADKILSEKLGKVDKLPEWKQRAYPPFEPKIESIKMLIEGERKELYASAPAHIFSSSERLSEASLCN